MAKRKKAQKNKPARAVGKETQMTKAELQDKLNTTLAAVQAAAPGVASAVAMIASLRQEVADAIANAGDLTEAAATADQIFATHEANAKALTDGMAAPAVP